MGRERGGGREREGGREGEGERGRERGEGERGRERGGGREGEGEYIYIYIYKCMCVWLGHAYRFTIETIRCSVCVCQPKQLCTSISQSIRTARLRGVMGGWISPLMAKCSCKSIFIGRKEALIKIE